jgi:hypothetical protein
LCVPNYWTFSWRVKESIFVNIYPKHSGFGGPAVSMLPSGTQDRGFEPGRSRRIFSGVKILSMASFGREVKQWVPCRRFVARKRSRRSIRGSRLFSAKFGSDRFSPD